MKSHLLNLVKVFFKMFNSCFVRSILMENSFEYETTTSPSIININYYIVCKYDSNEFTINLTNVNILKASLSLRV